MGWAIAGGVWSSHQGRDVDVGVWRWILWDKGKTLVKIMIWSQYGYEQRSGFKRYRERFGSTEGKGIGQE